MCGIIKVESQFFREFKNEYKMKGTAMEIGIKDVLSRFFKKNYVKSEYSLLNYTVNRFHGTFFSNKSKFLIFTHCETIREV